MDSTRSQTNAPMVVRTLRCKRTGRHFTGQGWAQEPEHARSFADEIQAVEACTQHGLKDVELVLRLQGAQTEFFATPLS